MASEKAAEEYAPREYRPIQIEEYKPIQEYRPIQEYKPIQYEPLRENLEGKKPAEEKAVAPEKPAEEQAVAPEKPVEEKKRAKWWKKPKEEEAVYTITGTRIK